MSCEVESDMLMNPGLHNPSSDMCCKNAFCKQRKNLSLWQRIS